MSEALKDTNQRLDEVRSFRAQEIEERLLKQVRTTLREVERIVTLPVQFEGKFQAMVDEQKATLNHEKALYKFELNALYQMLNRTQQNLTSSIDQVSKQLSGLCSQYSCDRVPLV